MIMGMSFVSVWVLNQDSAKEFYTKKLGCELTNDLTLDNGMRWLTVRPEGSTALELLLMDPAHSMLDAQTAEQVRAGMTGNLCRCSAYNHYVEAVLAAAKGGSR